MKICPRCQKTYADDNLNFCLEDGSVLTQASATPPPTIPSVTSGGQYGGPSGSPGSQPQWNQPQGQQYAMQPQKESSKTWIWVLLILGLVMLLCGGGIFGLLFYAGKQAERVASNIASIANNLPSTSNRNTSTTTTTGDPTRTDIQKIDLAEWTQGITAYGTKEFKDGELIMGSLTKGYYYVLAAPDEDENRTDDADTKVTLRNINDADSKLGYGLVFHSDPTPLQQGYAFLIDTKKTKYRVVHHTPQKEETVVKWTNSPAINGGSEENTLEVRDLTDNIELYINGTMVTSIKNVYGYAGGVPGLYAGDGVKIAFKDLEVRR